MYFCCPKCGGPLTKKENSVLCDNGHCYDISRRGYINLLGGSAVRHGDDGLMLTARRNILGGGYYDIFSSALCDIAAEYITDDKDLILDCGCGEGFYTTALGGRFSGNPICAFDVSKKAVTMACSLAHSRRAQIDFAVASSNAIPLPDNIVKILTNIFSPMACTEFHRVLTSGGYMIYAVPGKRHLIELKELIYGSVYENTFEEVLYPGFTLEKRIPVCGSVVFDSSSLTDLFRMTPYYYRSPRGSEERLSHCGKTEVTLCFDFLVYRKI